MVDSNSVLGSKSNVWKGIWSAQAPAKCKSVAWRACKEALPVKSLMVEKRILLDATCPCCGDGRETTVHALLQCEDVKRVWFASPLGLRVDSLSEVTSLVQWMEQCVSILDEKAMGMLCAITWSVWHRRNLRLSKDKKMDCKHVMAKAWSMLALKNWAPPPDDHVKANFAAIVRDNLGTGMGVVFRNSLGQPLASGTCLLKEETYAHEIAAALCYKWAVEQSGFLGFSDIIFETDCKVLDSRWKTITKGEGCSDTSYLDSVLEECNVMIEGTGSAFSLLPRTANRLAQCLAATAFDYGEKTWMKVVPEEASPILHSDMANIADE